jgi:hypothetical protein
VCCAALLRARVHGAALTRVCAACRRFGAQPAPVAAAAAAKTQ